LERDSAVTCFESGVKIVTDIGDARFRYAGRIVNREMDKRKNLAGD
jgi:hypothetical protein